MVWHHGVGGLGLIGDTCPDSLHDTCHRQSLTTYLKKLVLGLVPTPGSIPGAGTLRTIWYPRSRGFQIVLSSILVPDYLSKFIDHLPALYTRQLPHAHHQREHAKDGF